MGFGHTKTYGSGSSTACYGYWNSRIGWVKAIAETYLIHPPSIDGFRCALPILQRYNGVGKGIDKMIDRLILNMTNYRRYSLKGGCYFFTVAPAERWGQLLIENIRGLRTAFREVKQTHPFKMEAIVILPDRTGLDDGALLPPGLRFGPKEGEVNAERRNTQPAEKYCPDDANEPLLHQREAHRGSRLGPAIPHVQRRLWRR